jgi:hypothetical protein
VIGYNFTERTRKCLALAREEAARLRHESIGPEHILLGLVAEGEGVAATVLQNLGVELDELVSGVEQSVKPGKSETTIGPDLPYTSRGKKVLEFAMFHARNMHHSYVGTEHLLLGLIAEKTGLAARMLVERGVTLDKATAETLRILGDDLPRDGGYPASPFGQSVRLSQAMREIVGFAQAAVGEFGGEELFPVHFGIALLRHPEGIPQALLDVSGCDRGKLLRALEREARARGSTS